MAVRRFAGVEALEPCQILFVSPSEDKRLAQILRRLRGASVLTVGETRDFAVRGGVIGLLVSEGRVRFEINVAAAERASLRVSSKLLRLGRIVREAGAAGDGR